GLALRGEPAPGLGVVVAAVPHIATLVLLHRARQVPQLAFGGLAVAEIAVALERLQRRFEPRTAGGLGNGHRDVGRQGSCRRAGQRGKPKGNSRYNSRRYGTALLSAVLQEYAR